MLPASRQILEWISSLPPIRLSRAYIFFPPTRRVNIAIKAITVNLSDLVAKGAQPVGYQVALSFPRKPEEAWFEAFCSGLEERWKEN